MATEKIGGITLRTLPNALYVQYLADVDYHIQRVTPEALKIGKCYETFKAARQDLDTAFVIQRKNNETKSLSQKDAWRTQLFRCVKLHIQADLYCSDPAKREKAQTVMNKIDSYENLTKLGYDAKSAKLDDLGKELTDAILAPTVEELGRTKDVADMIEANNDFMNSTRENTDEDKEETINAKEARTATDKAYRDIVTVVNSQLALNELMGGDDDDTGEDDTNPDGDDEDQNLPSVQSLEKTSADPLADFAKSVNALIKRYKDRLALSEGIKKAHEKDEKPDDSEDRPVVE